MWISRERLISFWIFHIFNFFQTNPHSAAPLTFLKCTEHETRNEKKRRDKQWRMCSVHYMRENHPYCPAHSFRHRGKSPLCAQHQLVLVVLEQMWLMLWGMKVKANFLFSYRCLIEKPCSFFQLEVKIIDLIYNMLINEIFLNPFNALLRPLRNFSKYMYKPLQTFSLIQNSYLNICFKLTLKLDCILTYYKPNLRHWHLYFVYVSEQFLSAKKVE